MGGSKLCTHADHPALGNADPPQQQADTMTIRPREFVGPPMEVVARPTLTAQDQTLNYTENEFPTSFLRVLCLIILEFSSFRLGGWEAKARERRGCCCGSPAGCVRGICATWLS